MNFFNLYIILKFSLAGLIGVVTNFGITTIFKEYLKLNKYFSNSLGLSIALIFNFCLNHYFTFNISRGVSATQIFYFICVSLLSVYLNHKIVFFCNHKLLINFYFSKCIAVILLFIWNYTFHSLITFNQNFIL